MIIDYYPVLTQIDFCYESITNSKHSNSSIYYSCPKYFSENTNRIDITECDDVNICTTYLVNGT